MNTTPELFSIYDKTDERLYKQLEKHLALLQREERISVWSSLQISAGEEWREVKDSHLNTASIILLIISADFLASDICYDVEMQRAIERHEAGSVRVIPILLRPVENWQNTPFGRLHALPGNNKPITKWTNRDEAFASVVAGIRVILEDMQQFTMNSPATTFPRIWMIRPRFNRLFTGGEEVLAQLADMLKGEGTAILSHPQALSGLGGIGKTQIAVEYAYRFQQRYQVVLWTFADTHESLLSGYIAIADQLHLSEKDASEQVRIVEAVKHWLSTHREWLLILDNAEELTLVKDFLPSRHEGHILLTTRAQAIRGLANVIEVKTMQQETGALFLLYRTGLLARDALLTDANTNDVETAKAVSKELGGLPLALNQAGAYIEETQCGLTEYLQRYTLQRATLLKYHDKHNVDYLESVATTWSLSFEKVEQANSTAADLLRLCAFLHPDDIPIELITQSASYLGPYIVSLSKNPFALDEAIATLGGYSLLNRTASRNTLSIHRLVQAVILDEMSEAAKEAWTERVTYALYAIFPQKVTFEMWAQCERYLAHALSCVALIEQRNFMSVEAAFLLNRLGWYLRDRARFDEAERLLKKALAFGEKELGQEHPATSQSRNELARLYFQQERYKEAETLYRQGLAITLKVPLRPTRLTALNNLADTCRQLGKDEEALTLFQQALAIYPSLYEDEHPIKAMILSNLGLLYLQRSEYEKAELPLQQALAIRKKLLSSEDPEIAISLNTLAGFYQRQRQYEKAEPLLQQALKIDEKAYGFEHPEVARDLNELAEFYRTHGGYEEAEPLYQRALAICEKWLIPQHGFMAVILNNLGLLYLEQEKYERAKPLLQRALAIREEQLEPVHLDTAISLNNLGLLYSAQKRYAEAEALYMQALAIKTRLASPNHPSLAQSLNNLGQVYYRQGKHAEAESLYLQALEIREKHLGSDHPDTAESLTNLALLRLAQGKRDEVEPLLKQARPIFEHWLGAKHPRTVLTIEVLQAMKALSASPKNLFESLPQAEISRGKNVFQQLPSQKIYQQEAARRKAKSKMTKQSRKKNRGR